MGILDIFIPISSMAKFTQDRLIANMKEERIQEWNNYVECFHEWRNSLSDSVADKEAYEEVQAYWERTKFHRNFFTRGTDCPVEYVEECDGWHEGETPPDIKEVFETLPSYKKNDGLYPFKYTFARTNKQMSDVNLLKLEVSARLKLMEIGMMYAHDTVLGIDTSTYSKYADSSRMQTFHEFLQWYDDRLYKMGMKFPMMFLPARYNDYTPEQKEAYAIQVCQMDLWDEGIYFWYPNRHVAGLITKPKAR